MVWYKVGAMDEPPGRSGLAHLLEHLMFKGTPETPAGDFSRIVARNGGQENAFTSYDFTAYFQNIARDRLELVMRLEADRMRHLTLTEAQVIPERQVVLEERKQRVDNDPAALLDERANATLYLNHPYRRPVIGWEHEIARLTADDALAFYRQWYAPNNAILVVAGDVTVAEVKALAEKTYGAIPSVVLPARVDLEDPPPATTRRVSLADARVQQPSWQRSYPAPSYRTSGDPATPYALEVLAEVLGGGASSRLYRKLVVEDGIAVAAGAGYDPTRRGPGEFSLYASPRAPAGLARVEAAVEAVLAALLTEGVTDDEVARAKTRMIAEAVFARDSLGTPANVIGRALAVGRSVDDVEAWPERIGQVTPAKVQAAAKQVLAAPGAVTALLERPVDAGDPAGSRMAPGGGAAPRELR
jgi:zinc protease